eukprot:CAMPEP_0185798822 /NCGR_PEP_ID=MMETSP1174-20130828/162351_1 /TAXON_ID=35687 /ORGANISM="Dictyocha speculum, Strain CCMP1381" /LENGTH=128 /DNA_ID=CAMNT_0028494341 /DNA_START=373 /DNA_END=759 /DNA_ORIENTATION=+
MYVFGTTNFFRHLATEGSDDSSEETYLGRASSSLSRWLKAGFTLYWGQFGLPIPYQTRVTLVMGDPVLPVPSQPLVRGKGGKMACVPVPNPSDEQVNELLGRYMSSFERLFDQYKAQAGYPDAKLELL